MSERCVCVCSVSFTNFSRGAQVGSAIAWWVNPGKEGLRVGPPGYFGVFFLSLS